MVDGEKPGAALRVEVLPVAALKPYERNTRKHQKDDVEAICESIRRYGFNDPIGIWGDANLIVEGHGRLMAAQKLGMDAVPCIRLDHLSETQRREYAIAHNRTAELSAWDKKMLAAELPGLDMIAFRFGIDPKEDLQAQEDVFDCAAEAPLRAKYGSLWKLGGPAACRRQL